MTSPMPSQPEPSGDMAAAVASGPQPTLRIVETRVLRGPNIWAHGPVIRMLVDLGVLEEFPSNTIIGFRMLKCFSRRPTVLTTSFSQPRLRKLPRRPFVTFSSIEAAKSQPEKRR